MHLTALVERLEHVCCRYRLAAFQPHLERAGHRLELRRLPRSSWAWHGLLRELRKADTVILQRRLLAPWNLFRLRRAARCLLYDFDDAVFLRDSYATRGPHSRRRLRRFTATVRAADAVVAGNDFLRANAVACAWSDQAHVVPTCVDPTSYRCSEHARTGAGVQLVWLGSSSTLRGLEAIRPLLEHIGQSCRGVRLKVICDRFLELRQLPVLACPWAEATEPHDLADADVGISWLPDDLWSRGKCGLKVLQYMAAGLPVIANPVGVQTDMVRHGETGFLVETAEQWSAAVALLARDAGLRRRMGQAGRRRVETDFSVAAGAARWLGLLDDLERRRQAA